MPGSENSRRSAGKGFSIQVLHRKPTPRKPSASTWIFMAETDSGHPEGLLAFCNPRVTKCSNNAPREGGKIPTERRFAQRNSPSSPLWLEAEPLEGRERIARLH